MIQGDASLKGKIVSFLDSRGVPSMVRRCNIIPPRCSLGAYDYKNPPKEA